MRLQKFPDIPVLLEGNIEVPSTTSSEPLSPPDRDKRVDSLALSERVTDLPGAPQVEVRLKKKFET